MRLFLRPLLFAAAITAGSALSGCRSEADPAPLPGAISGVVTAQDEVGGPESAAGITVEFMTYDYPEYPQLHGAFEARLSILDLLFMVGSEAPRYMVQPS